MTSASDSSVAARLGRLDAWLRAWGPLLLVIFAIFYYGQYYRSGLNLGGEGGTVAVNAMRLNEGWLPIKDTTLNYNVLWFYPVAWLFRITGPDYIALRIYFFVLCLAAGLLGFSIVRRVSGAGWYALGVGLLIVAIPGMMFRNYMGLMAVANAWAMLHAFVWEPARGARRWAWFAAAGAVLGLTFLVRIDVALFFAVIFLGLAALYPLGVRGEFRRRLPGAAGGLLVGAAAVLAVHAPFYLDAQRRGFGREFAGEYLAKWNLIRYEAQRQVFPAGRPAPAPSPTPRVSLSPEDAGLVPVRFKRAPRDWVRQEREKRVLEQQGRPRPAWRDAFRQASFYDAVFVVVLYLPILVSGTILAAAGGALAWALATARAAVKEPALVCLVTLGSALTLFSQYFFFRPDTPHLSEFMVPFLVAMACAAVHGARAVRARSWILRGAGIGFVGLCAAAEGLYFYHAFPKESAGTIAAARRRAHEVVADNGVRVLVKRREQPWLQALHDTIVRCSGPDDWVITYPYSPTINFMTNRRSYLKDLYIDNATAGRRFFEDTVAQIESRRPAVIVIDQRDINDTEFSRFRNWAGPTYDYIRRTYVLAGTFGENEVYVRRDKMPPQT